MINYSFFKTIITVIRRHQVRQESGKWQQRNNGVIGQFTVTWLLWRRCDTFICTSGLLDDVMISHNGALWRVICISKRREDSVAAEITASIPTKFSSTIKTIVCCAHGAKFAIYYCLNLNMWMAPIMQHIGLRGVPKTDPRICFCNKLAGPFFGTPGIFGEKLLCTRKNEYSGEETQRKFT